MIDALIKEEIEKNLETIMTHISRVSPVVNPQTSLEPKSYKTVEESVDFLLEFFKVSSNRKTHSQLYAKFYKMLKIGVEKKMLGDIDEGVLKIVQEMKASKSSLLEAGSQEQHMVSEDKSNERSSRSIKSKDMVAGLQQKINLKLKQLERRKEADHNGSSSRRDSESRRQSRRLSRGHSETKNTSDMVLPPLLMKKGGVEPTASREATREETVDRTRSDVNREKLRKLLRTRPAVGQLSKVRERKRTEPLSNTFFSVMDRCRSVSIDPNNMSDVSYGSRDREASSVDKIIKGSSYMIMFES